MCAGILSYDSVTDELETVAIGVGTKFIENDTNTEFPESRSVSKRGIQNQIGFWIKHALLSLLVLIKLNISKVNSCFLLILENKGF